MVPSLRCASGAQCSPERVHIPERFRISETEAELLPSREKEIIPLFDAITVILLIFFSSSEKTLVK